MCCTCTRQRTRHRHVAGHVHDTSPAPQVRARGRGPPPLEASAEGVRTWLRAERGSLSLERCVSVSGGRPRRRLTAPRGRRRGSGGGSATPPQRASLSAGERRRGGCEASDGPGQNAAPLRSEPARDLANRRAGRPLPYKALLQVSLPSQLSSSWTPLLGAVSEPSRNLLAGAARLSARRPPPVPGALCRPLPLPRHRRQKRVSASPLACLLLGAFPEPSCRPRSARRGCVPRTRCGDTPPHSN